MKPLSFTLDPDSSRDDFGGAMIVTATTPEMKLAVARHFGLDKDPLKLVEILSSSGPYVHTCPAGGRDNAAWFEIHGTLELEFSTPYYNEYVRRTGDTGRGILPDLPEEFLTPYYVWHGLCHTHYLDGIRLEGGHISFRSIVHSRDWNGRTAGQRSEKRATGSIQRSVGDVRHEPEFLEMNNGLMRRNPKYLTQYPPHPALKADWLFAALMDHWLETKATPAQRELAEADRELMKKNHNGCGNLRDIKSYGTRELRRDWNGKAVSWDEFKAMQAA